MVNEIRMLRWICVVTNKDEIRNVHLRGSARVTRADMRRMVELRQETGVRRSLTETGEKQLIVGRTRRKDGG